MDSIPNVFSPNGDNINDFFHVNANFNECTDSIGIHIYNRWGQLIWDDNKYGFKWDGKNKKGNEVPDGVYYYVLTAFVDNQHIQRHGFIHILR
jgi:gliding motility-associated-like protein